MQALLNRLGVEARGPEAQQWTEDWIAKGQTPEQAHRGLMLAAAYQR